MTTLGFGRNFLIMLATAIAVGVTFYLLQEHWAHALGVLPYLLFLACPLQHLFMHGGHRRHDAKSDQSLTRRQDAGAGCH